MVLLGLALVPTWAQPVSIEELLTKAAREGTVRVIVELRVEATPPAGREAIEWTQALVLQELAGSGHRVLRRFATIPFMALEVAPDALSRLAASPHVASIREDMLLRPQGGSTTP